MNWCEDDGVAIARLDSATKSPPKYVTINTIELGMSESITLDLPAVPVSPVDLPKRSFAYAYHPVRTGQVYFPWP